MPAWQTVTLNDGVRRRNLRALVSQPETVLQAGDAVLLGAPEDLAAGGSQVTARMSHQACKRLNTPTVFWVSCVLYDKLN